MEPLLCSAFVLRYGVITVPRQRNTDPTFPRLGNQGKQPTLFLSYNSGMMCAGMVGVRWLLLCLVLALHFVGSYTQQAPTLDYVEPTKVSL